MHFVEYGGDRENLSSSHYDISGVCCQCNKLQMGDVRMAWKIVVVEPALSWLHGLRRTDRDTLIQVSQAVTALQEEGPALGRPLVDTIKGSVLSNLKELRPGSAGRLKCGCCSCSTRTARP